MTWCRSWVIRSANTTRDRLGESYRIFGNWLQRPIRWLTLPINSATILRSIILPSEGQDGFIQSPRSSSRVYKQFYIHYFDEMMNKLYKVFSTSHLCSHLLLIVNILLMKKEKEGIFLFVSDSILKSSMMRAWWVFNSLITI